MKGEKKSVVVVGGGTGTHTVLTGLKQYQNELDISAIVTMADSGGSTGRLRDEFGYLPVGDVRMALAALAREEDDEVSLLRQLFLHRFAKGEKGLRGHNVGNLLLVALTDILGSEAAAIEAATQVLRVRGQVLPVSLESGKLRAEYHDGTAEEGEHVIDESTHDRGGIAKLSLANEVTVNPRALAAIKEADCVVLGPGDLYTSVLANCVVPEVAETLKHTNARLIYICNLMTKRGQTDGKNMPAHVAEIEKYIGRQPDVVIFNTGIMPNDLSLRYQSEGEHVVALGKVKHAQVLAMDLLAKEEVVTSEGDVLRRSLVRHDPKKLAAVIYELLKQPDSLSLPL